MAQSLVLKGADLKIYIGGILFPTAKSITYTIDYGETEIYGIDSVFAQEVATTRVSVQGTVKALRLKLDGGLQGRSARAKIEDILHSPYTTLLIKDRASDIEVLRLSQMKVTSETFNAVAKGTVSLSFNFKGIVPYNALDIY